MSGLIQYYFLFILILSIIQEFILVSIYKIFKKDLHNTVIKIRKILFFTVIIIVVIAEISASIIIKEYWLSLIGIVSFIFVIFFYFLYIFISKFINRIQSYIKILY